ncbi:MAG: AAA family ATPase [Candidatus Competibacteraceae bacterium]|nr:AAA family ATPase [Candidatus Competibacteraceae bacterium]
MNYKVNVDAQEISCDGVRVAIRPQAFKVMIYLIENRNRVVSMNELSEQLWAPKVVSDSTLISCMKEVRRAVGDDGHAQRTIRTIHGRGYRFVASIEVDCPASARPVVETVAEAEPRQCWSGVIDDQTPDREIREERPTLPDSACSDAPSEMPLLAGEYKSVTVLVCRLADAKALAAQIGPEVMHALMQQFANVSLKAIQCFEGTVRRALDDGIEALFGVPTELEDHAQRAVQAAFTLSQHWRDLLVEININEDNWAAVTIGIHTGQIIQGTSLTNGQPFTLTAVGDTFELAHRLRRWAGPDMILLSEKTRRRVGGMVRVEAIEKSSSTMASPPIVYWARSIGSRRSPLRELSKPRVSRFVGRELELIELEKLWTQVKQGRGQVVGIIGEPGMGKSRLLYEFRRRLKRKRPIYLESRCVAYGHATPYLPVLDLLRHGCGFTATDAAETITAKIRDSLKEVGIKDEASVRYLLYLLGIMDPTELLMNLGPQLLKAQAFQTLGQLLINSSWQRPLVLEVEDLHWIDPTSEEFLQGLVAQLFGVSILLLVSYRPGYKPPWMDKSFATQITMRPLNSADSLTVLQSALKAATCSKHLTQHLLRIAEGNPFFLEELAQMVVQQSAQEPPLTVPDTIQAVLLGRIDRLSPEPKRLLQIAAIIGKEHSLALLQAVIDLPKEVLQDQLERLRAAELIYTTSLFSEPTYSFKHALMRETAYQSLLLSTRQEYHQRIAQILELRFSETITTQPELLAHHYTEAGYNAQAAHYWLSAGQRAIDRSFDKEAVVLLKRGLESLAALPEGPERFQQELALRCNLGIALVRIKGYATEDVKHNYSRAKNLCDQLENFPLFFKIVFGLWMYYGISGVIPTALQLARQLVDRADEGDTAQFIYAHALMGITLFHQGKMTVALKYFDKAIAQYSQLQQPELCVQYGQDCGLACLLYSAHILWCLGYPEQAISRDRKAFELVENLSHPFSEASLFYFSAWNQVYHRDVQAVLVKAEKAIRLSTKHGFPYWLAEAKAVHGWALVQNGAGTEGTAELEEGIMELSATGAKLGLCYFLILLAEAYGKVGNPDAGLGVLVKASQLANDNDEHFHDAELFRIKGELLLQRAPPDVRQAEIHFQEALEIARCQQAKSLELRAAMALCRLWQSGNKRDQVYRLLSELYSRFTEGFDSPDLKEAKALLAP